METCDLASLRSLRVRGVLRGKPRRTTTPAEVADRPANLVQRDFTAPALCQACSPGADVPDPREHRQRRLREPIATRNGL
jgi:hypothetical protein